MPAPSRSSGDASRKKLRTPVGYRIPGWPARGFSLHAGQARKGVRRTEYRERPRGRTVRHRDLELGTRRVVRADHRNEPLVRAERAGVRRALEQVGAPVFALSNRRTTGSRRRSDRLGSGGNGARSELRRRGSAPASGPAAASRMRGSRRASRRRTRPGAQFAAGNAPRVVPSATLTQTEPSCTATPWGVPSSARVAVTSSVRGSMRLTVPFARFATQTSSSPKAICVTPRPSATVRSTGLGPGAIRHTTPSYGSVAQTYPAPTAIPTRLEVGTGMTCATLFVPGSIRATAGPVRYRRQEPDACVTHRDRPRSGHADSHEWAGPVRDSRDRSVRIDRPHRAATDREAAYPKGLARLQLEPGRSRKMERPRDLGRDRVDAGDDRTCRAALHQSFPGGPACYPDRIVSDGEIGWLAADGKCLHDTSCRRVDARDRPIVGVEHPDGPLSEDDVPGRSADAGIRDVLSS